MFWLLLHKKKVDAPKHIHLYLDFCQINLICEHRR